MATRTLAFPAVRPRNPAPNFRATLLAMWQARRTRMHLAEMDAHLLADIGIGRGDAMTEADRPFWDLAPRRR